MTMLYIKYTSFVSCCCREDFFIYFHYKSMVDNDMPGVWPVWTPGAPLAAFIKERIIHWSTQHMKALGHMVSEKKIFLCFSHCKSMGANDPRGGAIFDPRGMIGRIYIEDHYTLLHTKYESFAWALWFWRRFFMFFLMTPGAGPVWTPGAQ